MLLNFDRKRLYIFGSVGLVLLLLIAFYHAPDYVPAEVSRMKTSVSTWLKGTEPSLSDETYKDSPHFQPPTATPDTQDSHEEHAVQPPSDHAETIPHNNEPSLQIVGDDNIDLLPPILASEPAVPLATSSKLLPDVNDFIAVLPPVDLLSTTVAASEATHSTLKPTEPVVEHTYSLPEATAAVHTYSLPEPTEALVRHTYSLPALETTFTTHVKPAVASATDAADFVFDEEKWY